MTKNLKKIIILAVVAALIVVLIALSVTVIPEGRLGVIYTFGKITRTDLSAGLHLKTPFVQSVSKVDVTQQVYLNDLTAYTKDTQTVEHMLVKVNYVYDTSKIDSIIRTIGIKNVESKIVAPAVLSNTKNIVGQYKAEELISKRAECQSRIEQALYDAMVVNGVTVVSVNIEEITFKSDFEAIVEKKVAAEQEALTVQNETVKKQELAKQKVIEAEAEAQSILLKAEAEAKANELLSKSITSNLVEYKKLETWDGKLPEVMGSTVNPFVTLN